MLCSITVILCSHGDGGAEPLISFRRCQNKAGSVARHSTFNEGKGSVAGSTPQDRAQVLIDGCLGEQYPSEVNLTPGRAQSFLSTCLQGC